MVPVFLRERFGACGWFWFTIDRFWYRLEMELAVHSDRSSTFFHIIHVYVSDGGQLAKDRLSTVDSTLLLSLVWEEAQPNQTVIEEMR